MHTFLTLRHGSGAELPAAGRVPTVLLVGLPGAGKTTVGDALALAMGRPFLDLDQEIERRQGRTIPEIFGEQGEWRFRELERAVTAELSEVGGLVVAPGGGWIMQRETVALVRPPGILVYLKVSPTIALERMGASAALRPLLARPDPAAELSRLLAERESIYGEADLVIAVDRLPVSAVVRRIAEFVGERPAGTS